MPSALTSAPVRIVLEKIRQHLIRMPYLIQIAHAYIGWEEENNLGS